ncbi:MAG TPA: 3'-5' exonuclease, partial [Bryobacteraceae bacterium]|nr:3'-5' exonuclease [Bryobacteraceae bacterium]
VELAERLCETRPPMKAVGEYRDSGLVPRYRHTASRSDGILNIFIPAVRDLNVPLGEVAILAPWWLPLFHLAKELRANGIPVVGPGARPYKRTHVFAQLAEPIGAYLESPEPDIARAVQRALFHVINEITGQPNHFVYTFEGRVVLCELLKEAQDALSQSCLAEHWLTLAAKHFADVLVASQFLPTACANVLQESAAQMAKDIAERDDTESLLIQDLGIFARPKHCIQLLTIHKAKGREFEAVAVLDAHDGRLPHFSISYVSDPALRQAKYEEARRLVYVAVTRSKRLLMFFTDGEDDRNRPSPFLEEMGLM